MTSSEILNNNFVCTYFTAFSNSSTKFQIFIHKINNKLVKHKNSILSLTYALYVTFLKHRGGQCVHCLLLPNLSDLGGASVTTRQVYTRVVRSKVLYSALVWVAALTTQNRAHLWCPRRILAIRAIPCRPRRLTPWLALPV